MDVVGVNGKMMVDVFEEHGGLICLVNRDSTNLPKLSIVLTEFGLSLLRPPFVDVCMDCTEV
nr:hypothetical protein Iba_scaffold25391CG0010 [Ipomoea batatas]GME20531.1 hypothetical protein Iba_scaffold25392CG0020 [Ipomoea batatas]